MPVHWSHPTPDICVLEIDNPPVNALGRDLVRELRAALDRASQEARGIVIAGVPGYFSVGADLKELARGSSEWRAQLGEEIQRLFTSVATVPVPIAAAVTGHCQGAGATLAILSDELFLGRGDFTFRFNFVALGLEPPPYLFRALERRVSRRISDRLLLEAETLSPEAALRLGLTDRLHDVGTVVDAAVDWVRAQLALPQTPYLAARQRRRADLVESVSRHQGLGDQIRDKF